MRIPWSNRTIHGIAVLLILAAVIAVVDRSGEAAEAPLLPDRISLRETSPRISAAGSGMAALSEAIRQPAQNSAWNDAQLSAPPDSMLFWDTMSLVGDPRVQLAASGLLFVSGTGPGRDLVPVIAVTGACTGIGKILTGQARPHVGKGPVYRGPSLDSDYAAMPSAHTSISFAAAAVWSEHYPQMAPAFYTAAGFVGLSRIVLDKHWPSNVIIGALLGYFLAQHYLQR